MNHSQAWVPPPPPVWFESAAQRDPRLRDAWRIASQADMERARWMSEQDLIEFARQQMPSDLLKLYNEREVARINMAQDQQKLDADDRKLAEIQHRGYSFWDGFSDSLDLNPITDRPLDEKKPPEIPPIGGLLGALLNIEHRIPVGARFGIALGAELGIAGLEGHLRERAFQHQKQFDLQFQRGMMEITNKSLSRWQGQFNRANEKLPESAAQYGYDLSWFDRND